MPMHWNGYAGARDCYCVTCKAGVPGLYWYLFKMVTTEGEHFICRSTGGLGDVQTQLGERFQMTVFDGSYPVASWFGEGITYNIFPDRFARTEVPAETGYRSERHVHENWSDTPVYLPDARGEIWNNDFFGGSLRGVIEKLDYLESLHVRTIYFNPMFEAFSNHRYDTGDYKTIDPMMGTEDDFRELCAKAKARGMRVILDGVFSHTGYDSKYFNARGHYDSVGAYQSKESPYFDWYDFSNWPNNYSSWWGIYTLPQVRELNDKYLDYIIEGEDSVIRHWLNAGASGWRLDVADELPDEFIAKLNQAARETKPDALVVGEVWEDASNKISYDVRRRYFQGGELDSVMNYPLRDGIMAFLSGSPAEDFAEKMETLRENYPRAVFYNLMNIIGTHDTPRALTALGADPGDWGASREFRANKRLTGEGLARAKRMLRIAATIQFTMPGSPTIYYGDEAGQQGYEDPFNRRTYPWGEEDEELLEFYRGLCAVRAENPALTDGSIEFLEARGGLLLYVRGDAGERVLVAVNRTAETQSYEITGTESLENLLDGAQYVGSEDGVVIELAPESAALYRFVD
ncbi:MAG: glycoside hydrolase family 13 protein [Butyricicoccus sp.]|nr:glycoside hydrolase family 13 protein [Butyricicoccus sp.]